MKHFLKSKARRAAAVTALAVILALVLGAAPSQAGPCERALGACLLENSLAGLIGLITSGGLSPIIMAQFCASGYAFCLQYIV